MNEAGGDRSMAEKQNSGLGSRMWLMPVLLALPLAAGLIFAAARYGNLARNLIQVAVKLVVTK